MCVKETVFQSIRERYKTYLTVLYLTLTASLFPAGLEEHVVLTQSDAIFELQQNVHRQILKSKSDSL